MSYRFLPWVRQGLASEISTTDDLGPTVPDRARLPVRVKLSGGRVAANDVALNGPGDVIGLDPRSIIRVEPPASVANADPDQFAAIEFDNPDLPWIFSPFAADSQDRLRPWLVLAVVAEQDGVTLEVGRGRPLPCLTIEAPAVPDRELPELSESWAWAHGQIVGPTGDGALAEHLAFEPDRNVSRILCPRRLEPDRRYLACLVPAFETGRLAGLGEPVLSGGTTRPAWTAEGTASSVRLPVYHHWSFTTGPSGDFESLARRLTPRPVSTDLGSAPMFIGDAHPALPPVAAAEGGVVALESALRAPNPGDGQLQPLPGQLDDYVSSLVDLVNAPADHAIDGAADRAEALSPPLYGGPNVFVERLDGAEPTWLGELNRDPRLRAVAGLGAEVVRQNQDAYMNAAWAQVGDVIEAIGQLDKATFLGSVANRTRDRHVQPLVTDTALGFSAPVHQRVVVGGGTVRSAIDQSFVPTAVTSSAYRRMASPRSPYLRRAGRELAARRAAGRATPTSTIDVTRRLATGALQVQNRPTLANHVNPNPEPEPIPTTGPPSEELELGAVRAAVLSAIDPAPVAAARAMSSVRIRGLDLGDLIGDLFEALLEVLRDLLDSITELIAELFEYILELLADIMVLFLNAVLGGPDLSVPMFRDLAAHAPERFLDGTGSIPDDTITVLEPNPRFIEAFLIGANHEMNRELLWRRFPTFRRGTPLRLFWDRTDGEKDLPLLYQARRDAHLGEISDPAASGALTLLIRGQLLRRFPDAVIYAVPANSDGTVSSDQGVAINPLFWGRLDPDIVCVGFDLTREQAVAGDGWCFVLAEQPASTRFGLDGAGDTAPPATWNNLSWAHIGVEPGDHLQLAASGLVGVQLPLAPGAPPATFGRNSAHLAAITMQRPFRAVIHARDLVAGVDRPSSAITPPVLTNARILRPINGSTP